MVAASDCTKEFMLRRDQIAKRLFSSRLSRCSGFDRIELAVPDKEEEEELRGRNGCDFEAGSGSKESKVNSSRNDREEMNVNVKQVSNYRYGEAEALTDEIEQESQIVVESDSMLFESLRKLQLMVFSVDALKGTEIGMAVHCLRKHGYKQIRHPAKTLIE